MAVDNARYPTAVFVGPNNSVPPGIDGARVHVFSGGPHRDYALSNKYWNIETKRQSGSGISTGTAVGATNKDFHVVGTAEQNWDAVRLILLNAETANSTQAVTASFAPTANMTTVNSPTGSWTTFTWSAAGSVNFTNSSSNQLYTTVTSDWMSSASVTSVARDDGGTLPMFMFRIHLPTGAGTYTYTTESSGSTSYDTDLLTSGRRWYKIFQSNIDSVTTPASFTQTTESNLVPACILQFRSRGRILSFMGVGDSIMGGSLTTSNMLSPGFLACSGKSSSAFRVQYVGSGWASQTTANYLANAKTLISALNPQACAYSVYSPNDGALSSTIVATQLRQAMDFIQHCRANDCLPILVTPTPDNTDAAATSTLKAGLTTTLLALRSQGVAVVDWWSYVAAFPGANASTGYGWITGYYGDNTHPNDTGAAVMAAQFSAIIQDIILANA